MSLELNETAWKCCICLGVTREPVTRSRCWHCECEKCMRKVLVAVEEYSCTACAPIDVKWCRMPFTKDEINDHVAWPLFAMQMKSQMRAECENYDFVSATISAVRHERNSWEHPRVVCARCPFAGRLRETIGHALQYNQVMVFSYQWAYPIRHLECEKHNCRNFLYQVHRRREAATIPSCPVQFRTLLCLPTTGKFY